MLEAYAATIERQTWNPFQIRQEFEDTLNRVQEYTGESLTMNGRSLSFVKPSDMIPKTGRERRWYIDNYGEGLRDGAAGDCRMTDDGNFIIRIGFLGNEEVTPKNTVIDIMAHEYGHSLSFPIEHPIREELKAYTFADLFMRVYLGKGKYKSPLLDPSYVVHATAQLMLEQFLSRGTPHEAILAHLLGRKFGGYMPSCVRSLR